MSNAHSSKIYASQQRCWQIWTVKRQAAIRSAYPDTAGNENLMHNWYICHKDEAISAPAVALRDGMYSRWNKVKAWFAREYDRAQHEAHIAEERVGAYLWCERCQNTLGKHVEHYTGPKGERFTRVVALAEVR
jgi:hypothetical protein